MDKKKTNKKKLSTLIKQQVPEFVLSDHPKFTEFLTSYFLFMESAELNLDTFTAIDQILLETVGTTDSFVLLNQTNKNGLDANNKLVNEENTFAQLSILFPPQSHDFSMSFISSVCSALSTKYNSSFVS